MVSFYAFDISLTPTVKPPGIPSRNGQMESFYTRDALDQFAACTTESSPLLWVSFPKRHELDDANLRSTFSFCCRRQFKLSSCYKHFDAGWFFECMRNLTRQKLSFSKL
mmetsp:Transcript_44216/g.117931  ORF Transcript_44216/g.117931 Transcript_44216/m.117931 type:complete len:109 (-) Transcript_44216:1000-1326(-)